MDVWLQEKRVCINGNLAIIEALAITEALASFYWLARVHEVRPSQCYLGVVNPSDMQHIGSLLHYIALNVVH